VTGEARTAGATSAEIRVFVKCIVVVEFKVEVEAVKIYDWWTGKSMNWQNLSNVVESRGKDSENGAMLGVELIER
jgi:hypothetical protein